MDAATLICEEWEKVSRESIAHCWVKSSVLPMAMSASVVSLQAEYWKVFACVEADVDEVLSLLRGTTLAREVVGAERQYDSREGMRAWLAAEDEEDTIVDTADLMVFSPDGVPGEEDGASGAED